MSEFIVSARKYRPATFRSVVGQQHITSTLQNAIERGQLAHAYLFCGPRGVGKTTCARIFAKAINCLDPHGAEACNACESCRSFNEGRSLNIHELDAASNNSVEDIRTLIEQVRIIPQVGRYSVFIIDEVHMLSAAAFNAFLKTLEEPPAHAVFILATTEKHKIIPTILSRCQIYDFNRIRVEDGVDYLKYIAAQEGIAYDDESLNLIAQKADGGMRDALSMFDKAVSFCGTTLEYKQVARTLNVLDYDTYFGVTEMLLAGNYTDVLVAFDRVLSRGFSGQTFMAGLNRHMRDLLMAKHTETLRLIEMTGTLLERYRTQAEACSAEFLFGAISLLTELDGKIRQSSNRRLLVELGLMKICGLGQKKNGEPLSDESYPLPPLTNGAGNGASNNAGNNAGNGAGNGVRREAPQSTPAGTMQASETMQVSGAVQTSGTMQAAGTVQASGTMQAAGTVQASGAMQAAESSAADHPAPSQEGLATSAQIPAPQPGQIPAPHPAPSQEGPATSAQIPAPHPAQGARPGRTPLISGASISALMASATRETQAPAAAEHSGPVEAKTVDPACADKLEQARPQLLELIRQKRPRFVQAFEQMKFGGSTVAVSVPTPELREEILRSKTAMLRRFAEIAGVQGAIELEVTVNEAIRAARPIKLEDRIRYMTEKNPLLTELRKALDLEVE